MFRKMRRMLTLDELKTRLQKLNDAEVARVAGLDRGTVLKLRKGLHTPNLKTFEKLCAAVKVLGRKKTRSVA